METLAARHRTMVGDVDRLKQALAHLEENSGRLSPRAAAELTRLRRELLRVTGELTATGRTLSRMRDVGDGPGGRSARAPRTGAPTTP